MENKEMTAQNQLPNEENMSLSEQNQMTIASDMALVSGNVWQDKKAFNQLLRASQMLSQSTLVPQIYQGKPQDCFIAAELASRMNTSPIFVMQNLYVVKGRPSWSGQACKAMIDNSGKFIKTDYVYTGKEGTDSWGCYFTAIKAIDGEVVNGTEITIKMAKDEGWYHKPDKYGKETSKWPTMPKQMLAYRAAAFFARMYCPECLMGLQIYEEVEDISSNRNSATELTNALNEVVENA